jgi:hypothetical protein
MLTVENYLGMILDTAEKGKKLYESNPNETLLGMTQPNIWLLFFYHAVKNLNM